MQISGGKFVITGGASLIGSHVADHLLGEGAGEVVLLDNFSLGTPETVAHLEGDARVMLLKGDILRINELYDAFAGAAGVFAIAGFLTLPLSQNPPLGLAVNVEGQVNTFEACRYAGVKKVVFSSSIAAYGEPEGDGVIDEMSPANLASYQPGSMLYSCTKLIGEALCKLYSQTHGIDAVALRYSTVYGERQHYRGVNALTSSRTGTRSSAASARCCRATAARCMTTSTSPMWRGPMSWPWPAMRPARCSTPSPGSRRR